MDLLPEALHRAPRDADTVRVGDAVELARDRGELVVRDAAGTRTVTLDAGASLHLARERRRVRWLGVWPRTQHWLHVRVVVGGGSPVQLSAAVPSSRVATVLEGLPWKSRANAVQGDLDALCALVGGLVEGGVAVARWAPGDAVDPEARARPEPVSVELEPPEEHDEVEQTDAVQEPPVPALRRMGRTTGRLLARARKVCWGRIGIGALRFVALLPVYFIAVLFMTIAAGFLLLAAQPGTSTTLLGGVAGGLGAALVFVKGLGPSGGIRSVGLPGFLCFPLFWLVAAWPPAVLTLPLSVAAVVRWTVLAGVIGLHAVWRQRLEATSEGPP